MWHECTPLLDEEPGPAGREITGWRIPGIGEMDIESEGFRLTVEPSGETLRAELAFAGAYAESPTEPYRPLGPMTLVLEEARSLRLLTPGTPAGPLWKRFLRGEPFDEVLRMTWDETEDTLHVRDGGSALVCRGGAWRWETGG
ncbi:hypothetical protein [Streptomyces sp. SP18CS02]|uniref:hypothetical protein n=1 Tax=Streptomyces sp. SP18CS02 TaxID=3002531 RepID=UPI002E797B51|nr:hypothetical protein [Streptomyces sp. SP18CS02]MEE1753088.1 hypothetical protein [Streptomyces sp. SP18CS02]